MAKPFQFFEIPHIPSSLAPTMRLEIPSHWLAGGETSNARVTAATNLHFRVGTGMCASVKSVDFNKVKREEARSRMKAEAKASGKCARAKLQRQASLVGDGAKWRITNFKQVARAMSRWA